jgi:hypothetical protein
MSAISQNIEELEGSVDRAQAVLDQAQRALEVAESAQQHAAHAAMIFRQAIRVLAIGGVVAAVVMLLHRVRT